MGAERFWSLEPDVVFLNHGSFGACPRPVQAHQSMLRARIEAEPVRFFTRELVPALDEARARLGAFLGADPEGLVFVSNATEGVNAALGSWPLSPGDEILVTDHGYGACNNAAAFLAERAGARVIRAALPFPIRDEGAAVDALMSAVTARTRLALIDHVTSPTALVLPIERIIKAMAERGVEVIVDGAHGPGMCPLALDALGAAFYTGNCHKWVCAPKGAAFLHIREDLRRQARPTTISHGARLDERSRPRLRHEFDWPGTRDPTPWLCIAAALDAVGAQRPGGWSEIMTENRDKALAARAILCEALGLEAPAPASMVGAMSAVVLPRGAAFVLDSVHSADPLHDRLFDNHRVEVPVIPWPSPGHRVLRVSAHLYNHEGEYRLLAERVIAEGGLEGR